MHKSPLLMMRFPVAALMISAMCIIGKFFAESEPADRVLLISGIVFYAAAGLLLLLQGALYLLRGPRLKLIPVILLLLFVYAIPGGAVGLGFYFIKGQDFFGPSEDDFAKDLKIPRDLKISLPSPELKWTPSTGDAYQSALLAAIKTPSSSNPALEVKVPSLRNLSHEQYLRLLDYLAKNPAWRVYRQHDGLFATRLWQYGKMWRWNLHGYFSATEIDPWAKDSTDYFQIRTTIDLEGKNWFQNTDHATRIKEAAAPTEVKTKDGNAVLESLVIAEIASSPGVPSLAIEIFEQSLGTERRLTKTLLNEVEKEFHTLFHSQDNLHRLLPPDAIRSGATNLELINEFQPGIYSCQVWANPGEAGAIYLKAFEVTKGTPLSEDALRGNSEEMIGWSTNSQELFYGTSTFTIYEGDWDHPYAARFELWFHPLSGSADRKLLEKIYKIEGWQR